MNDVVKAIDRAEPGRADRSSRLSSSLSGTNLVRAGDHNQRVVLQAIRLSQTIIRSELAAITGLTQPTIANIVKRLVDLGLVSDAGRETGRRGMPPQRLTINGDGGFAIGVNIDRDHASVVTLDLAGRVRTRSTREMAFPQPGQVQDYVAGEVARVIADAAIDSARVLGVGVAIPSSLGSVPLSHRPAEFAIWDEVDVAQLIGDVAPWPVYVENDAAAATIGEMQFGRGRTYRTFIYILLTAGLGGGVIVDGDYFRGETNASGRIGFLDMGRGAVLQDLVSLSGVATRLEAAGLARRPPEELVGGDPALVATMAQWIEDAAAMLAAPLQTLNLVLNPGAVLIGGRLPEPLVERLAARLNRLLASDDPMSAVAPVLRADLSADAPAIGAAILPFSAALLPSDAILMVSDPLLS